MCFKNTIMAHFLYLSLSLSLSQSVAHSFIFFSGAASLSWRHRHIQLCRPFAQKIIQHKGKKRDFLPHPFIFLHVQQQTPPRRSLLWVVKAAVQDYTLHWCKKMEWRAFLNMYPFWRRKPESAYLLPLAGQTMHITSLALGALPAAAAALSLFNLLSVHPAAIIRRLSSTHEFIHQNCIFSIENRKRFAEKAKSTAFEVFS